ncbi:hypothetical protein GOP47_0002175 [Adiantum capillus-veneris]|uniref:Uncharacterized protein n=1 Tax=Adiantum capillus-veneris TaxID=13818 RepID=A0A9D4ZQZ5_ADICA|nr:hypothetical protein GOP47_0002175 [Adiantum capillus-veneris]
MDSDTSERVEDIAKEHIDKWVDFSQAFIHQTWDGRDLKMEQDVEGTQELLQGNDMLGNDEQIESVPAIKIEAITHGNSRDAKEGCQGTLQLTQAATFNI